MSIMIISDHWHGEDEEKGAPFSSSSGRFYKRLLALSGINYDECYVTCVFNFCPRPYIDIKSLIGPKTAGIPGKPMISKGGFIRTEFAPQLERLYKEIDHVCPTLILALGSTVLWALNHKGGIKAIRGTTFSFRHPTSGHTYKVLPTHGPVSLQRDFSLRPVVHADLEKARRESEFPDVRRPQRSIWIEPAYDDLLRFEREHISPSDNLSIDIETAGDQITCIGFAPTKSIALVVPFVDTTKPGNSYWPTHAEEVTVWRWVKHICALEKAIVGQNFLYDMKFLWMKYGIPVPHHRDDTMLLHHALQPEMEKGLGFLGSVYTDEASWKMMRKNETIKQAD